jgi:hypothetical protein
MFNIAHIGTIFLARRRLGSRDLLPGSAGLLIKQNYIEERTVDVQPAIVINKAKLPEFVDEKAGSVAKRGQAESGRVRR